MNTLTKDDPLGTLGLPTGDHWVKFHVEDDAITFEVAASAPEGKPVPERIPTGFVQKWSATARKKEDLADAWLSHINEKHLR